MGGRRLVIRGQGLYYLLTGLWPIVSMSSFEAVTGPKADDWLVHMVGLLAMAVGIALLVGASHRMVSRETVLLSCSAALAFIVIDSVYALRGTISRVYLGDAAVEAVILLIVLMSRGRRRGRA